MTPSGNLITLKKTSTGGAGSVRVNDVKVRLRAEEVTDGGCHPDTSTDTFSLRLLMVDDDGDVILDETRAGLACNRRVGKEIFSATYDVMNCKNSVAPANKKSKGDVSVTATTNSGVLMETRSIKCKR